MDECTKIKVDTCGEDLQSSGETWPNLIGQSIGSTLNSKKRDFETLFFNDLGGKCTLVLFQILRDTLILQ